MKNKLYYLKKVAAWLLPYTCILCGQQSKRFQDLCEACLLDLPILTKACAVCAKPFVETVECCANLAPSFDRTYALFFYQMPITRLIMDLKFGQALVNARVLGELMADRIQRKWYQNQALPQAIIPVPMHPLRLKKRGYNQAVEIARPIAKRLNLALEIKRCRRVKYTHAQATLHAQERSQNVKNAFKIEGTLPFQHVAILDDVITTGNTVSEFAKTLKNAGVKKIDVWCCARPHFE